MTPSRRPYFRALRAECLALGLCPVCRRRPRVKTKCAECAAEQVRKMRALRAARKPGQCHVCRRQARPGRADCQGCHKASRAVDLRIYRTRAEACKCVICGGSMGDDSLRVCGVCVESRRYRRLVLGGLKHG